MSWASGCRRVRDAVLLNIVLANAYHLIVIAGRWYSATRRPA